MNGPKRVMAAALAALTAVSPALQAGSGEQEAAERGRYLLTVAGCNDCHTAGFSASEGSLPDSEWLMGESLGWQGPWGTTYASNLRLVMTAMTADQWVVFARNLRSRPPMPSYVFKLMAEEDLRAMHAFVSQLGPRGEPAPAYLPPGVQPDTPYVVFPSPPAKP